MPPRVTILVPTFEPKPDHLEATIRSAVAQTMTDWELFIHDDASRADVCAMIEPYLHDARINFIKNTKRRGIGGNWNACLPLGTAPFVQFLFQDDAWDPTYLEKTLATIEHDSSVGLVAVNHRYRTDEDAIPIEPIYQEVRDARANIAPGKHPGRTFLLEWSDGGLRPNVIGEPSFVLLRRSIVEQVGRFDATMQQALDYEYWIRMLLLSDIAFVAEELGTFRVHEDGATTRNDRLGAGLADRLACFERLLAALPDGPDRWRVLQNLVHALADMIRKYRRRKQAGGNVRGVRKSDIIRFALRHPIVMMRAGVKAMKQPARSGG